MLLQTQEVVEWLATQGDLETAFEVEGLPPEVDTDQDREVLVQCGVDVEALIASVQGRQSPA